MSDKYIKSPSTISGIYLIKALVAVKGWGIKPVYVGSSKKVKNRIYEHFFDLRKNQHCNTVLQNYYNKYGEEALHVDIIEVCDEDGLQEKEQKYLDLLKPFVSLENGFNIALYADSGMRGRKLSEEFKNKLKEANRASEKIFTLISPTGEEVTFRGLKEFCRIYGVDKRGISAVIHEKVPSYKGWRKNLKPKIHNRCKTYQLLNPKGEIVEVRGVKQFAKENNLNISSLNKLLYNVKDEYKGWRKPKEDV